MRVKEIVIPHNINVKKLMLVAEVANQFESDLFMVGANFKIDAKSLMGLLASIRCGLEVTVTARGDDEEEALRAVLSLLE